MGLTEHRLCNVGMCSDNPFTKIGNIHCTVWGCFMLWNNDMAFVFTCLMFSSLSFPPELAISHQEAKLSCAVSVAVLFEQR